MVTATNSNTNDYPFATLTITRTFMKTFQLQTYKSIAGLSGCLFFFSLKKLGDNEIYIITGNFLNRENVYVLTNLIDNEKI